MNTRDVYKTLVQTLQNAGYTLALAESCTGGLLAAHITDIPGASAVLDRGFVTYSNQAKTDMLGFDPDMIETHGAVSAPVARAMAEGALQSSKADIAASITGIAGPGGGTGDKPVGLVHFGLAHRGHETQLHRHIFEGDRASVRSQAAAFTARLIQEEAARNE